MKVIAVQCFGPKDKSKKIPLKFELNVEQEEHVDDLRRQILERLELSENANKQSLKLFIGGRILQRGRKLSHYSLMLFENACVMFELVHVPQQQSHSPARSELISQIQQLEFNASTVAEYLLKLAPLEIPLYDKHYGGTAIGITDLQRCNMVAKFYVSGLEGRYMTKRTVGIIMDGSKCEHSISLNNRYVYSYGDELFDRRKFGPQQISDCFLTLSKCDSDLHLYMSNEEIDPAPVDLGVLIDNIMEGPYYFLFGSEGYARAVKCLELVRPPPPNYRVTITLFDGTEFVVDHKTGNDFQQTLKEAELASLLYCDPEHYYFVAPNETLFTNCLNFKGATNAFPPCEDVNITLLYHPTIDVCVKHPSLAECGVGVTLPSPDMNDGDDKHGRDTLFTPSSLAYVARKVLEVLNLPPTTELELYLQATINFNNHDNNNNHNNNHDNNNADNNNINNDDDDRNNNTNNTTTTTNNTDANNDNIADDNITPRNHGSQNLVNDAENEGDNDGDTDGIAGDNGDGVHVDGATVGGGVVDGVAVDGVAVDGVAADDEGRGHDSVRDGNDNDNKDCRNTKDRGNNKHSNNDNKHSDDIKPLLFRERKLDLTSNAHASLASVGIVDGVTLLAHTSQPRTHTSQPRTGTVSSRQRQSFRQSIRNRFWL